MNKIKQKLPNGLFAILDPEYNGMTKDMPLAKVIEAFADADATPFIVRAPHLNKTEYTWLIDEITALRQIVAFDFIIHSQIDAATGLQAAGIHLTAKTTSLSEAKKILGPEKWLGYSAHSCAEALQAIKDGADYIFLGAIFDTPKPHAHHPVLGINELSQLCAQTKVPIYAIGGIDETNLNHIKNAGATGFSALRAVYKNGEIEHNTAKLKILWDRL